MSSKEEQTNKTALRFKKELMVIAFVVSLLGFFWGAITLNNWVKFSTYRNLASEVTEVLGGVDKRSDNWNCSLNSVNCPSVRLIKNVDFKDNDEARARMLELKEKFNEAGFDEMGFGICSSTQEADCSISGKKNGLKVILNAKPDFIGVDIYP